jgi:hypothetical protein
MLSELKGTPLRPGTQWDEEARAAFAAFQRSEGLRPTGEPDDISTERLKRRFEQVADARRSQAGDEVVHRSPSSDAHHRVEDELQLALHSAEQVAHQLAHDSPIRARYVEEAQAWSKTIMKAFEKGEITEGEAALLASRMRNAMLVEARGGLSPAGAALSRYLKEEGIALPALVEKYAQKRFGKTTAALSAAERNAVCLEIAKKAGVTNELVNAGSKLAPYVGKALMAVTIAIAIYQVATAENPFGEGIKQGAGFVGFWAGARVGGTVGAGICGPVCGVLGGLAGGILGAIIAEEVVASGPEANVIKA